MAVIDGERVLYIEGAMSGAVGVGRAANQDFAAYVVPEADDPRAGRGTFALIADGMGGHAAGEVASALAGDIILRRYYAGDKAPDAALLAGFRDANAAIRKQAKANRAQRGMGTTCTAVVIRDGSAWLAHIGDSRLYLFRQGDLYQLSEDHSLVGELLRAQLIDQAQARVHPERNVIIRALGTHPHAKVDVWNEGMALRPGDRLLLCSDGLSDAVEDALIADMLQRNSTPYEACQALVAAARRLGGLDDISVGVFAMTNLAPTNLSSARITKSRPIGRAP